MPQADGTGMLQGWNAPGRWGPDASASAAIVMEACSRNLNLRVEPQQGNGFVSPASLDQGRTSPFSVSVGSPPTQRLSPHSRRVTTSPHSLCSYPLLLPPKRCPSLPPAPLACALGSVGPCSLICWVVSRMWLQKQLLLMG